MEFFVDECKTVYETIKFFNLGERGEHLIPESDVFIRDVANTLAIGEKKVMDYLHALRDSHHIFILNIAKEDEKRKIRSLDGYILAEKDIIGQLLPKFEDDLHKFYKADKHMDKSIDGIIKEYLPDMHIINSTQVGKVINIVTMLREFAHFLENHPEEFSDSYREAALETQLKTRELLNKDKIHFKAQIEEGDKGVPTEENWFEKSAESELDAEDSESAVFEEYAEEKMGLPFEKALQIYGLKFIIRLYFRKNKYSFIEELVRQNKYFDLKDLKFIRETLKETMKNLYSDNKVNFYKTDIFRLDRTLNQAIRKYNL